jgi:hypothetical protein
MFLGVLRGSSLVLAVALLAASCGRKGPPLLPYQRIPAAAEITAARRVGNDVFVTVTVPAADVDDARPASVAQIEVWGVTATTAPPPSQFLAIADRVATIPVARYADPSDSSGAIVPDPKAGALQGAAVTIRDTLTSAKMAGRTLPTSAKATVGKADPAAQAELRRFYMTLPTSARRRAGPPSKIVDVALTTAPNPVTGVHAAMKGRNVVVEWEPSGGLSGFLLERVLPAEIPPIDDRQPVTPPGTPQPPAGPTLYNIYRDVAPDPLVRSSAVVPSPWSTDPATPINAQPVAALTFTDLDVPFDERRRCYHVRAVRGTGAERVESEPSTSDCIIPVDTEAPAQVTGLNATVTDGQVMLRWEPNGEEDLRGYLVLRKEAGDDTLRQLTPAPITDTRFPDSSVMPGRMYTYVVQAVDNRLPVPNASEPSEIPATAR